MRIRTSILATGIIVVTCGVGVFGLSHFTNARLDVAMDALNASDELKHEVSRLAVLLVELDSGNARVRRQVRVALTRVDDAVADAERDMASVVDAETLSRLGDAQRQVAPLVEKLLASSELPRESLSPKTHRLLMAQARSQLELRAEQFLSAVAAASRAVRENTQEAARRATAVMTWGVGVGTVGVILALGYLAFVVLPPLARLERGARALADGELEHRIRLERGDEMGRVAGAFDDMGARLQYQIEHTTMLEQRLRTVVDNLAEGVALYDRDDRLVLFNQSYARMNADLVAKLHVGVTFEELVREGSRRRARLAGDVEPEAFVRRRLAQRAEALDEIERTRPDGGTHLIRDVRTDTGEIVSCLSDITELKRREQRLSQSNEALTRANAELEEFTYVVSHDLKAPLRGIRQVVEWLVEDLPDDSAPSILHNMTRLRERAARLELLIEDLLKYSRATRSDDNVTEVDVSRLVATICDDLEPGEAFTVTLPAEPVTAMTAPTPLATVLRNLIGNALKHHDREQGTVDVSIERDDARLRIAVTDDGPGIPTGREERIFRLFQTLSPGNVVDGAGSGIGLTIAKRIVERHGGELRLESPVHDGRGVRFVFTWPMTPTIPSGARSAA